MSLRKTNNEFIIPYYSAFVLEHDERSAISIADGYGLHPIAEIAATRAVTEAAQSRLTHIHGGRDDIVKRINFYQDNPGFDEFKVMKTVRQKITSNSRMTDFYVPSEQDLLPESIEAMWELIKGKMASAGLHHCFVYVLSPADFPFCVLRVVIPFAEFIDIEMKRVGHRFINRFQNNKKSESGINYA